MQTLYRVYTRWFGVEICFRTIFTIRRRILAATTELGLFRMIMFKTDLSHRSFESIFFYFEVNAKPHKSVGTSFSEYDPRFLRVDKVENIEKRERIILDGRFVLLLITEPDKTYLKTLTLSVRDEKSPGSSLGLNIFLVFFFHNL